MMEFSVPIPSIIKSFVVNTHHEDLFPIAASILSHNKCNRSFLFVELSFQETILFFLIRFSHWLLNLTWNHWWINPVLNAEAYQGLPGKVVTTLVYSECIRGKKLIKNVTSWASQEALVVKEPICQCGRCKRQVFDPWVRKLPWRRAWQSTPVFFPGKSHGYIV